MSDRIFYGSIATQPLSSLSSSVRISIVPSYSTRPLTHPCTSDMCSTCDSSLLSNSWAMWSSQPGGPSTLRVFPASSSEGSLNGRRMGFLCRSSLCWWWALSFQSDYSIFGASDGLQNRLRVPWRSEWNYARGLTSLCVKCYSCSHLSVAYQWICLAQAPWSS